jgi:hypothetical protein
MDSLEDGLFENWTLGIRVYELNTLKFKNKLIPKEMNDSIK